MAVSDPLGITAQPLPPIRRESDDKDIDAIAAAVREYDVRGVVLGLPLHLDGGEGTQARKTIRFESERRKSAISCEM